MKKLTLFLLTALLLASVFAGCSASAYMDDPYAGGYSNVSTTRNGTVNGTNGRYAGYGYGYDANGTYTGTYSNGRTTEPTTPTPAPARPLDYDYHDRPHRQHEWNRLVYRYHLRHGHGRRPVTKTQRQILPLPLHFSVFDSWKLADLDVHFKIRAVHCVLFQNEPIFPEKVQRIRVPLRNRCRKPLRPAPPFCADRLTEQLLAKAPAAMGFVE